MIAAAHLKGAMSIDVEEHFHAAALASGAPRAVWDGMESRVVAATETAMSLFADAGVKATFFTLGIVAERHPALLRRIAEAGHEIASHGHAHWRIREQSPAEFRADVIRTKASLEDASGQAVVGYRAANFSLDAGTWWAYDILAETGHRYSSSINPVRHDHYGMPDAPTGPFLPGVPGIVELPMTTVAFGGRRWHASGGGWFRLMPYALYNAALGRAERNEGLRGLFYFHPWEVDPGQPRIDAPLKSRLRHYVNLDVMGAKLAHLMRDRPWGRVDDVFAAEIAGPALLPGWSPAVQGIASAEQTPCSGQG